MISPLRKVISTETYEPKFAPHGGFRIIDTLECGHTKSVKGSAGFAYRRRCLTCLWEAREAKYESQKP